MDSLLMLDTSLNLLPWTSLLLSWMQNTSLKKTSLISRQLRKSRESWSALSAMRFPPSSLSPAVLRVTSFARRVKRICCPVCRTSFEEDISILASSLVSFLLDIPCSAMTLGCSFTGTLDQLEIHLCPYKNIFCFVCGEQMRRMEFFNHNNSSCFFTDANNSFLFPVVCSPYPVNSTVLTTICSQGMGW